MSAPFFAQLFARDPRKEARFPDLPLDQALAGLQELIRKANAPAAVPQAAAVAAPLGSMPPVVPVEEPAPAGSRAVDVEPAATTQEAASAPATMGVDVVAAVTYAPEMDDALASSVAGLATQVWRARGKVIDPETGETREEMRRVGRHIDGAFDVFAQMGLVLKDWVGQPYDAGLPVKVLTFQPTPGISRDTVVEAVRPTVIWKERVLQLGEVIIGTPEHNADKFP